MAVIYHSRGTRSSPTPAVADATIYSTICWRHILYGSVEMKSEDCDIAQDTRAAYLTDNLMQVSKAISDVCVAIASVCQSDWALYAAGLIWTIFPPHWWCLTLMDLACPLGRINRSLLARPTFEPLHSRLHLDYGQRYDGRQQLWSSMSFCLTFVLFSHAHH